jgi:hypothetical protein
MNSSLIFLLILSAAVSSDSDVNFDGAINVVTTINYREGVVTVQLQADGAVRRRGEERPLELHWL